MIVEVPLDVREKLDELVEAELLTPDDANFVAKRFSLDSAAHWRVLLDEISREPRRRPQ